jgi:hypothetical protein
LFVHATADPAETPGSAADASAARAADHGETAGPASAGHRARPTAADVPRDAARAAVRAHAAPHRADTTTNPAVRAHAAPDRADTAASAAVRGDTGRAAAATTSPDASHSASATGRGDAGSASPPAVRDRAGTTTHAAARARRRAAAAARGPAEEERQRSKSPNASGPSRHCPPDLRDGSLTRFPVAERVRPNRLSTRGGRAYCLVVMNLRLALSLLTVLAVAPYSTSADGAGQPPKRSKRTCPALLADIESIWKRMKIKLKVTPDTWGDVPAPLRKLPAGAERCGVGAEGQAIIASAAFGQDLENHYAPLFAELGCKPLKCNVSSTTNCTCSGGGGTGVVVTDTGAESYTIMYSKRSK